MKKRYYYLVSFAAIVIFLCGLSYYLLREDITVSEQYSSVSRAPVISPDYTETVIPPNIAPLNFIVKEKGSQYSVRIYSTNGGNINLYSKNRRIVIPAGPWKELLNANRGQKLYFDVYAKDESNQWLRFETITNTIASEDIDTYLIYRKLYPSQASWREMGIYQRNVENHRESVVVDNSFYNEVCMNCHAFCGNRPDKMFLDVRSMKYGSSALLVEDGARNKIAKRLGFITWHPSGRLVVCSISSPRLLLHTARRYVQDIVELDSALIYYLLDSGTVKTSPKLAQKDRLETYPTWSPDGRYLYFCSAPMLWSDRYEVPPQRYDEVKYDLVRISYDPNSDTWGELETVLSAKDTGLSILEPRISPDGRWLLFCMCDYGSWPIHHPTSDLYIMDLEAARQTGQYKYRRLEVNSDQSEAWHSWSTNSRWIAFSSKRRYEVFTRIYFSYVDHAGTVYKPIILPQKDPEFYEFCLKTHTIPEFLIGPVEVTGEKLVRVIRGSRQIAVDIPISLATPKVEAIPGYEGPWKWRE